MVFIVEMAGGEPETPDFRFYACHADIWPRLLALGRDYGWKPAGTTLNQTWAFDWKGEKPPTDYECEDYGKLISREDAAALADALELALQDMRSGRVVPLNPAKVGLLSDHVPGEEIRLANADLEPEFLEGFIEFLRKGEFSFFWDD